MLNIRINVLLIVVLAGLAACSGSGGDDGPAQFSNQELLQFSSGLTVLSPANLTTVSEPTVSVSIAVPAAANATKVDLLVNGVVVASDTNGAPWSIDWSSYFWSNGGLQTLSLRADLNNGQSITSQSSHQVFVSSLNGSELKFADGLAGSSIQDVNSLEVSFDEVDQATAYQLQVVNSLNPADIELDSTSTTVTDLPVGLQRLRYRGGRSFSGSAVIFGAWSDFISVSVLPPELPENISSFVVPNNTVLSASFDATITWDAVLPNDTYTVSLTRQGVTEQEEFVVSGESSLTVEGLPPGEHLWQLGRRNEFGHESQLSDVAVLEAGVFTNTLGGSGNESAARLISTSDGGAAALAYSFSTEITGLQNGTRVNWIFEVDEFGGMVWEYVDSASPSAFYSDMVELADGSVIAFGTNGNTEASALKLDAAGQRVWQRNYPGTLQSPTSYRFTAGAVGGSEFALVSNEQSATHCTFGCQNPAVITVHSLDTDNGDFESSVILATPVPGFDLDWVVSIGFNSTGNRFIGGIIVPSDQTFSLGGDVFIAELDATGLPLGLWRKTGFDEIQLLGVAQLSNGDYAVSTRDSLFLYEINRVTPELDSVAAFSPQGSAFNVNTGAVQETSDGRLFSVFPVLETGSFPPPGESRGHLRQFDASLNTVQTFALPAEAEETIDKKRMVVFEDNSALILYQVPGEGNDPSQIIIRKLVLVADP